jgi:hypothetical protein
LEIELEHFKAVALALGAARRLPAEEAIAKATEALWGEQPAAAPAKTPRRWFKGVAGIVKGAVLLTVDGTLLATGAPIGAPPAAVAVVGSLAMGFEGVVSGVGDVRGE